jgi:hypothetical protein
MSLSIVNAIKKQSASNEKTQRQNITDAMTARCCAALCIQSLPRSSVEAARKLSESKNQMERTQWLLNFFEASRSSAERGKNSVHYHVDGVTVCRFAFQLCYDVSRSKMEKVLKLFEEKTQVVLHGNSGVPKMREGTKAIQVGISISDHINLRKFWLERYINLYCDKSAYDGKISLPACMTWKMLYDFCVEELQEVRIILDQ